MPTPAELREEARRCIQASRDATDSETKKRLAARAFELAQQAEALERSANSPLEKNGDTQKPG